MTIRVKNVFLGMMFLTGAALMSKCTITDNYDPKKGIQRYMQENGYTQKEQDSIINSTKRDYKEAEFAAIQSKLDSMAYRNLFNQTNLVNNSYAVNEFNKIAQQCNLEKTLANCTAPHTKSREFFKNLMEKNNVPAEQGDSSLKNFPRPGGILQTYPSDIQKNQYYIDRFFYRQLFEKLGLMSSKFNIFSFGDSTRNNFINTFQLISDQTNPLQNFYYKY